MKSKAEQHGDAQKYYKLKEANIYSEIGKGLVQTLRVYFNGYINKRTYTDPKKLKE